MSNKEVDPNEAPEGYYAVEPAWKLSQAMCKGCAFDSVEFARACADADCTPGERDDRCNVIFKEKEE